MQDFAHLKKTESAPYSLNRTKNKNMKYKLRHHEKKKKIVLWLDLNNFFSSVHKYSFFSMNQA